MLQRKLFMMQVEEVEKLIGYTIEVILIGRSLIVVVDNTITI